MDVIFRLFKTRAFSAIKTRTHNGTLSERCTGLKSIIIDQPHTLFRKHADTIPAGNLELGGYKIIFRIYLCSARKKKYK